jgi:hypothetical protein
MPTGIYAGMAKIFIWRLRGYPGSPGVTFNISNVGTGMDPQRYGTLVILSEEACMLFFSWANRRGKCKHVPCRHRHPHTHTHTHTHTPCLPCDLPCTDMSIAITLKLGRLAWLRKSSGMRAWVWKQCRANEYKNTHILTHTHTHIYTHTHVHVPIPTKRRMAWLRRSAGMRAWVWRGCHASCETHPLCRSHWVSLKTVWWAQWTLRRL